MFCSISGTVPEEPVVNRNNGQLFEKSLIEKHVQETGNDPITNEPTTLDDLLPVKTNKAVKPRPSPATSIPGLLGLFHNEWDALMLESHQNRTALHTARQELAHALYLQDAACRVIARLTRERDAAREALENAPAAARAANGEMANGSKRAGGEDEQVQAPAKRAKGGFTKEIEERMTACSQELSKGRKKRVMPEGLATPDDVGAFSQLSSHPLHKTTKGGILSIDTAPGSPSLLATAGADGAVVLFDRDAGRIRAALTGHSKRVNSVKFGKDDSLLLSGGADATVRLWRAGEDGTYSAAHTLTEHSREVVAVTLQATGDYFVSASVDATWAFCDTATGAVITQVKGEGVEAGYASAEFHPDGLILGTGTQDALVRIWETRQQKNVANFEGHSGPVRGLCFSENGYFLATSADDGVRMWDLRKLKTLKTLPAPGAGKPAGLPLAVRFDWSGLFLALGGTEAACLGVKQDWAPLYDVGGALGGKWVSALHWARDARTLYVGTSDHNLRVFGAPAAAMQDDGADGS